MELEYLQNAEAWTRAALERFTRGPEITMTLSRFLQEKVEMENKLQKIRRDFVLKWDRKLRNCIGSNLPKDDIKEVMSIIMTLEDQKASIHSQAINQLQDPSGPIVLLNNYIYGSGYMMDIINLKNLYNDAMGGQRKLEKNITSAQKHYFHLLKKLDKIKAEVDVIVDDDGKNSKFWQLGEQLRQLESNAATAKELYEKSLQNEKENRSNFIAKMRTFHADSDKYETERLANLKTVLQTLFKSEQETDKQRFLVKSLCADGLQALEKYDIQREVAEFNQLVAYQYKFPEQKHYKSDKPEKERLKMMKDKKSEKGGQNDEDVPLQNDEVKVLKPRKDNDVLFVKTAVSQENLKVNNYSRHVALPPPNPVQESYMPSFDLPNVVANQKVHKNPVLKTTTIDMSHDSDSSSDETAPDDGPMKIKTYGVKTFIARTEDEISFKKGHKVYMTKAANIDGLAYGYVKKGKLFKKKVYGFFPAKLVSTDAKKKSSLKPPNPFKKSKKQEVNKNNIYITVIGK